MLNYSPQEAAEHLAKADKKLAKVIAKSPPFALSDERLTSPFEALSRAIVYQQLSGKAAATIFGRVKDLFPGKKKLDPALLLAAEVEQLRSAGLSGNKTAALKDLAAKTLDGTVPTLAALKKMEDAEIIERLVSVRGIGIWTVEMLLIFRLGRPDVLPVSDLGVRKGFMLTYGLGEMPTAAEMLVKGERWRPFRSVASWYMWRATELLKVTK